VKMSSTTCRRASTLLPNLQASRPSTARLENQQFLFDTNETSPPIINFVIHTKQSTSFFLFNTNERLQITSHRPLFTRFRGLRGRSGTPPFPLRQISMPCGLTPPSPLRTMRRMQRKRCPGAPTNI
jgi:hypothetical protein